jgi:hypothetical protein
MKTDNKRKRKTKITRIIEKKKNCFFFSFFLWYTFFGSNEIRYLINLLLFLFSIFFLFFYFFFFFFVFLEWSGRLKLKNKKKLPITHSLIA